jgi:N-acetylmuramoyl-L-alanine amidase
MPSVLVELGFLSNKEVLKFLASKEGQSSLAKEMFDSFKSYKIHTDKVDGISGNVGEDPIEIPVKTEDAVKKDIPKDVEKVATGIVFKVQIATSTLNLPTKPENFKGMLDVEMIPSGKWFKYFVGNYSSYEDAKDRQTEVREKGYDTAFMVAYEDGKKVDVKYAAYKSKLKK